MLVAVWVRFVIGPKALFLVTYLPRVRHAIEPKAYSICTNWNVDCCFNFLFMVSHSQKRVTQVQQLELRSPV